MEEGNLVEHRREPLRLLLPVQVQTPDGVVEWFLTHGDLRDEGLFGEVHQRTTQLQVLREVVLPIHAYHCFALHAVLGVRFTRRLDVGLCVDDALVGRIVHGVVRTFLQFHTSCRHLY